MELPNFNEMRRHKGGILKGLYDYLKELNEEVKDAAAGIVAAGSISTEELANGAVTEQKIGTGAVTSGKVGNGAIATAKLADDSVNAAKAKIVVRAVVIAESSDTATVTNAADIDGIVIGAYPADAVGSAIEEIELVPATGALTVTLAAAQAVATPGTVNVIILQN